jgi:hypothetical protein
VGKWSAKRDISPQRLLVSEVFGFLSLLIFIKRKTKNWVEEICPPLEYN